MGGAALGFLKQIREQRRAELCHSQLRNMCQTKFPTDFRRAVLVPKQDDLGARAQPCPTGNCIPLDDPGMPVERLRSGKNRQHRFALLPFLVNVGRSSAETPSVLPPCTMPPVKKSPHARHVLVPQRPFLRESHSSRV